MATTQAMKAGGVAQAAAAAPADPMAPFKKAAAETAINKFVKSGMKVGIGTGSTMKFGIDQLGARLNGKQLKNIVGVSTSDRTTKQATDLKIPLKKLDQVAKLDLAIDGADEVAKYGNAFFLIKGMGGALLQEKAVAQKASHYVIVVDDSKLVRKLGTKSPLPIEVGQKDWQAVSKKLLQLEGVPVLRQDKATGKPYVTDNGNFIIDVKWTRGIANPQQLARTLDGMPAVKAHGLFLSMADEVIVASPRGTTTLTKNDDIPGDLFAQPAAKTAKLDGAQAIANKKLDELLATAKDLPVGFQKWVTEGLTKQAAVVGAQVTMHNARARIASGELALPPIDRANLPKTEDEAIHLTMNRLGLTKLERASVEKGIKSILEGGLPPATREPIGGHSSVYAETFRTQMAITDPGLDHMGMTVADDGLLDGNFVHMEIIDRDTEHMAPYANPGFKSLAMVRMLLGNDAPSTAFFGRPNYIASTKQDTVEGLNTAQAAIKYNLPTAANWMANAARSVLNMGYSEAKFGMDGLGPKEVEILGKAVHEQANLQEGEYISAATNLNSALKDYELVPRDAAPISGAPTKDQRELMLKASLMSVDAAVAGGFKKVTLDSASMTPPSYPLLEYFGIENCLIYTDYAHERGRETYGSGGMRDYHFPALQLAGWDGVGVGFSIHEAPTADAPGKAGRLLPEKVASEVAIRNAAEKAPVGKASTLLRMLAEKISDGTATPKQKALHAEVLTGLRGIAHGMDEKLDVLKATRDTAIAAAKTSADPKAGEAAAKKTFEEGFKELIQTSLNDPTNAAAATALLDKGLKLGVEVKEPAPPVQKPAPKGPTIIQRRHMKGQR